ncbi:MAG: helix-turn-helix transcriptional regulator [Clostridia bacterium]|nr:helix-turn-helix transcriptional regulator [Clostridia bacterium]
MKIDKVEISKISPGFLCCDMEGVLHKKITSALSVVMATRGSYDIKIGDSQIYSTGEGGAFIAPSGIIQEITHHNGEGGYMRAKWTFIDATVNGKYKFDDLYKFPIILDKKYNAEMSDLIEKTFNNENAFEKTAAAYSIINILAKSAEMKEPSDDVKKRIEFFVLENYASEIGAPEMARALYCSASQIFRYTRKYFGVSPANYVNGIRLQKAENLIRSTDKRINEICFSVGFSDLPYFVKLFKKHYGESPTVYRRKICAENP